MKNQPLVSIIMPLYNKRPYVGRTIESVQKQTYTNWELIIMDDGSTDGSADEVPHDDQRIKLYHQENRGPSAARNRAIEKSSGEFIALIDADDCYYPMKIQTEIDLLWKEQKAEWMMSAYDYELDNNIDSYFMKDISGNELKDVTLVFDNALTQLTVTGWPSDGLFMRRDLFKRLGGFHEGIRLGEITEFILRCALMQPRVLICHKSLYHHIDVPGGAAKELLYKGESSREMGESLQRLAEDYPEYSDYLTSRSLGSLYSYFGELLLSGKNAEARRYLLNGFPYGRSWRWCKMWLGSWMPIRLLHRLIQSN